MTLTPEPVVTSDNTLGTIRPTQTVLTTTDPAIAFPRRLPGMWAVLLLLLTIQAADLRAGDWTFWRGPEFNGISRETGLIDDWDPKGTGDEPGTHVLWRRDDLGGRSTPVVMDGRLYTIVRSHPGTSREGERVVCVDAATGKTIWENPFNVYLSDVPAERIGWSSCVADPETGKIYAQGVCGLFQCIDGKTGNTLWKIPLHERFGLLSTYGARTNFPVLCEDLVIVSAIVIGWGDQAKPEHRFLGLDKNDGTVVWNGGTRPLPYDTSYSAPTITCLGGQKSLVVGCGDGAVWALQPRTGQSIWQYRFSRRGLNVAPLVVGDDVFASHSEENIAGVAMGSVVGIDGLGNGDITDTGELWKVDEMMVGKSAGVCFDGRLYVADDRAKLFVLDTETGETIGRKINLGSSMRSSLLYADGKIYAFTQGGRWYILEPDEDAGAKKIASGRLLNNDECHASPIVANGRLYMQTSGRLYCLADPDKSPGSTPAPDPVEEAPLTDSKPAHLQIVPCEILLQPGQTQTLTTRLFNAKGQFLSECNSTFTVDGKGAVDDQGVFSLPPDAGHGATIIHATAEGVTGTARVRSVPPLPWKFDFENIPVSPKTKTGEPPVEWVGCRYRHVIRDVDGNNVMAKVTTIPKGTRSRGWFGQPELHDYTIQADIFASDKDSTGKPAGSLPDIGLIAQGYTIDLQGAAQELQIRSWVTQLRMATTVPYPWKANTWYTLKLKAVNEGSTTRLYGKVWPRDAPEPAEWTITATDPSPTQTGSPGLYGNAKIAEIRLDNIEVTANDP